MTQSVVPEEGDDWQPNKISLRDLLDKVAESAPGAFPDYLLDADTDGGDDGTR